MTLISSDTVLRTEAMRILIKYLGTVETERFIASIKGDRFDYTEWQQNLWEGQDVEEIYHRAAEHFDRKYGER